MIQESAPRGPHEAPDVVHAQCSEYRSYGWRLDHDQSTGDIALVVDGQVSALQMPSDLGAEVDRTLAIHMLAGPVIGYQSEQQWVFLTEPVQSLCGVPDTLASWDVKSAPAGTALPLPPSSLGSVRWINEPDPRRPRPPWHAVISATRRVLSAAAVLKSSAAA